MNKYISMILILFILKAFFISQCSTQTHATYEAFGEQDETAYIDSFSTLIKDSYSAPLPQDLAATCKNQNQVTVTTTKSITSSMLSSELQIFCGTDTICIIPTGFTVTMNSNLNVAALVVSGSLIWNDASQSSNNQWLCAGYIAVDGGQFNMNLINKQGYIYIKNNGLKHPTIYTRALASCNAGKIYISGRYLARTWSLLANKATYGMTSISLSHKPEDMGWKVGDRIVIAPTVTGSSGTAEDFTIGGFEDNNTIKLLNKDGTSTGFISSYFQSRTVFTGANMSALIQAEVINLARNIIITGDDFQHVNCVNDVAGGRPPDHIQADHCSCWNSIQRTKCTLGLHTAAVGPGSVLSLQYTRIEKCGQRGILGKYCVHLHLVKKCPDCKIIGNAFEYGHQRGTTIHGTHLSTVENNVYNDIRGATIYVEDGNEMYNRIFHNVAICPWAKSGEKRGCTIPGTDNGQADTTLNQAGLWGLSFTNYAIGNRFANNYNGMLYQEQGFGGGRGHVDGLECPSLQQMGRLEGNTFHGCGRFGTYVLASVFPKRTDRSIDKNGLPTLSTCREWTATGEDNGLPATFMNNIDYDNVFVGQYGAGDLQYRHHTSINNNNLIYWKETKNFQDGCSAHIADSFYDTGNLGLPGGHGAFILENMVFNNRVHFESSHHCDAGVTGVLCMPTYVFINMKWTGVVPDDASLLQWGPNNGAMFTLGPDDENNLNGNKLFPAGFNSIINPYWSYLLALDNGASCFSSNAVATLLGQDPPRFAQKYNGGAIFCKRPVRRLEIFSFNQNAGNRQNMQLELWQFGNRISSVTLNFFQIGDTRKQGYSATIIPGLDHQYRLSMVGGGNVSPDWIIEFSDPVFGNRWKRDEIDLVVAGRNCPYPVHSQHDRRYIWSGDNYLTVKGRGACTAFPDMSAINCKSQPKLSNVEHCPEQCLNGCRNGYCDCATGECLCNAGFSGVNCSIDTCGAARCVNGVCAAQYLGGDLPVTNKPCVCIDGWYGDRCDTRTPPPPVPDPAPTCFNGWYYYIDSDIGGGQVSSTLTSDAVGCGIACNANAACTSWVYWAYNCYLKTGTQLMPKPGVIAGIKCSAGTNSTTIAPTTAAPITTSCDGKCHGQYPYGCYSGFQHGYCNEGGGCAYSAINDPNWCCFKGCDEQPSGTNPPVSTNAPTTVTQPPVTASCDGKCKGQYPYGCNASFQTGFCNAGGGCYYSATNDPNWCCFKGC
ncbi:unnamed protein product [Adineta steineri]|uniref:EGF-like domain-containing protein n=1 Tax=Adineta steineri TaxID=433720 RepID=A0A813MMF7_9BILA|nr:unnamed protein product [Adineta steineri]CAF4036315.1 unnamed protein product [Adineta steineri]